MKMICLKCNKEFETQDKRRKFCCLKCSHIYNPKIKTLEVKKCLNCSKDFSSNEKNSKFCNMSCAAIYNNKRKGPKTKETKNKISESLKQHFLINGVKDHAGLYKPKLRKCLNCEKEFLPDKSFRKYCSTTCFNENRKAKVKNEISYRTFQKILSRAFKDWKCPFCDWTHSFHVHHMEGRENAELENLIMLCPNHHSAAHLGILKKEEMKKYAIANFYSKEILLNNFYNGENKNINFTRYESEISKSHQKERNSQIVKLDKYDDWENSKII